SYWSIADSTSPFQPWLNRNTFVGFSAFTFSRSARLNRPPSGSSVLSFPSASKDSRLYLMPVSPIVRNDIAQSLPVAPPADPIPRRSTLSVHRPPVNLQ